MIKLTRLDGSEFLLNSDLIEMIDKKPDTTVRLYDKKFYIVQEDLPEIIEKVVEFRRSCNENSFLNKNIAKEN